MKNLSFLRAAGFFSLKLFIRSGLSQICFIIGFLGVVKPLGLRYIFKLSRCGEISNKHFVECFLIFMGEAQNRYRATPIGKQKHREHMREYMIAWRKSRKESQSYDIEEERRKWREQHKKVREKAMEHLGGKNVPTVVAVISRS